MKNIRGICFFVLFLLSFLIILAHSGTRGVIRGRVSDDKGRPVAEARVEVVDAGIVTVTDKHGAFSLDNLEVGKYHLIFSHPDFMPSMLEVEVREKPSKLVESHMSPVNSTLLIIREEITVTAEADSLIDVSLPSHRNILTQKALDELGSSNLAESVRSIPGVDMVGKGGHSMSPAIRGLAEHRTLLILDGARITSERRIGANASFVNLNDIDRIEVNRGPYSVYYGSGAIGGVINMFTRSPFPGSPFGGEFQMGYNTSHDEQSGSIQLRGSQGKYGFLLSANGKKAGEYKSPLGAVLDSDYSDYNLFLKVNHTGEKSNIQLSFLDYYGKDIGKPGSTSLYKPRCYPEERNTIFSLGGVWENRFGFDALNLNLYLLLPSLETKKENLRDDFSVKKRNIARIEGSDFGIKLQARKKLSSRHLLNLGLDYFGRRNLDDSNTEWSLDAAGNITSIMEETTLVNAALDNIGFFIDDNVHVGSSLTLKGGARFDFISTVNLAAGSSRISRDDSSFTAYIGGILQLAPNLSLLANLGRSFRFPTMSELYYSGLTGRGTVFGNPDLDPETGLNLDVGIRYLHPLFYASVYCFFNQINGMIEKYSGPRDEEFFYHNLIRGKIRGLEGDFYLWPAQDFEFKVNFHLLMGRNPDTKIALNYIPPPRINLAGKWTPGRFWIEPRVTISADVDDPGPLETEIDGHTLLEIVAGFEINRHFKVMCIGQNLSNALYRYSADVNGVEAPGRGMIFRILYRF